MSTLTKLDVQKKVLKDGKPLGLDLFEWDEETRTFYSIINGLELDFNISNNVNFICGNDCSFVTNSDCTFETGDNCLFRTNHNCTFKTGDDCEFDSYSYCKFETGDNCLFNTTSDCSFITGSNCTFYTDDYCDFITKNNCSFDTTSDCKFETGDNCSFKSYSDSKFKTGNNCIFETTSNCTFKTGYNCTVERKFPREHIKLMPNIETILCPYGIKGYLYKKDDKYVYSEDEDNEYIIIDHILSKVISRRGNILKVRNHGDKKDSYIIQDGDIYSHGETIEKARESLIYKIGNRDTSVYDELTMDTILEKNECIKMYRVITGACEYGTRSFIESLPEVKSQYSIEEIIELTRGRYGNDKLVQFMANI